MQVTINFKAIAVALGTVVLTGIGWWMATVWGNVDSIKRTVVELEKRDVVIVLHSKALDDALEIIKDLDNELEILAREVATLKGKVDGAHLGPMSTPSIDIPPMIPNLRSPKGLDDYKVGEDEVDIFRAEQRALPVRKK